MIAETFGLGLGAGESSTYFTAGAQPNAPGALSLSLSGGTDVPLLGGTLYSFSNVFATVPINADANGGFSLVINGDATMVGVVSQAVFVDARSRIGQELVETLAQAFLRRRRRPAARKRRAASAFPAASLPGEPTSPLRRAPS